MKRNSLCLGDVRCNVIVQRQMLALESINSGGEGGGETTVGLHGCQGRKDSLTYSYYI